MLRAPATSGRGMRVAADAGPSLGGRLRAFGRIVAADVVGSPPRAGDPGAHLDAAIAWLKRAHDVGRDGGVSYGYASGAAGGRPTARRPGTSAIRSSTLRSDSVMRTVGRAPSPSADGCAVSRTVTDRSRTRASGRTGSSSTPGRCSAGSSAPSGRPATRGSWRPRAGPRTGSWPWPTERAGGRGTRFSACHTSTTRGRRGSCSPSRRSRPIPSMHAWREPTSTGRSDSRIVSDGSSTVGSGAATLRSRTRLRTRSRDCWRRPAARRGALRGGRPPNGRGSPARRTSRRVPAGPHRHGRGGPAPRYTCLTGNCQLATVWARLYDHSGDQRFRAAALSALGYVMERQSLETADHDVRGGIKGSQPVWGAYAPFAYPSWAGKFFIDAMLCCMRWWP